MKAMLYRILAMLTRMAMKFDGVAESVAAYDAEIDYDKEHRRARARVPGEESPQPRLLSGDTNMSRVVP
jgi:hypothetical protein